MPVAQGDVTAAVLGNLRIVCYEDDGTSFGMELLEKYPEFREIYEEVYQMCRNVEGIMSLFSKELEEMDRNTVSYMIEELEAEVKAAEERAEQERQEKEAAEERAERAKQQIAELQERIRRLESAKKEELE